MKVTIGPILGRSLAAVGVLLLAGLFIKLIVAILQPVLPVWFMLGLTAGWGMLWAAISPAIPAIAAAAILVAIVWIILGRRW
ncbi:hypothetical protein [Fodinicola acaciae]|uniref:hypothetical protein n=1 Tax=Fodinicola acaciae TaxID=2681555 RepID=UPI0013D5E532|nr:hypothetical protein [Fodinicola acaciae]